MDMWFKHGPGDGGLNTGQRIMKLSLSEVAVGPEKGRFEHVLLRSCSAATGRLESCSTTSGSRARPLLAGSYCSRQQHAEGQPG